MNRRKNTKAEKILLKGSPLTGIKEIVQEADRGGPEEILSLFGAREHAGGSQARAEEGRMGQGRRAAERPYFLNLNTFSRKKETITATSEIINRIK